MTRTTTNTTYLVTGANRGIGFALAKKLSEDKNNFVFVTARDAVKADALKELGDNVKVMQLDVLASLETIKNVLQAIGDRSIDVVIHNAGILIPGGESAALTDIANWTGHLDVNTLGPIKLYQAVFPYWSKPSAAVKKFVFISSAAGSMGDGIPFPSYGYGLSKAALNYFSTEIAREHATHYSSSEAIRNSITIVVHPGAVATDMTVEILEKYKFPALTPAECAESILTVVRNLKSTDNGTFKDYDGAEHPW